MTTYFLFEFFVNLRWCCVGTGLGGGIGMDGGIAMGGMELGSMLTTACRITVRGSEAVVGS